MIAFLLNVGDFLEYRTRAKSLQSLTKAFQNDLDSVWVRREGQEIEVPAASLLIGDQVVVRAGSVIPVDGVILNGEALIQQASMTGEPLAVHKQSGEKVLAGTVLEEGELTIATEALPTETRFAKIASFR